MTHRLRVPLVCALLAAVVEAAPNERLLVALDDYPPYYDALIAQTREAGLSGTEAVVGLSVVDGGVRVMPVKVAVSGRLPQIVGLLSGLHTRFPYASRIRRLQMDPSPAGAPAWRVELMLLSPVKPSEGAPAGTAGAPPEAAALERRIAADRKHGAAFTGLMEALARRKGVDRWLRSVRMDGGSVAIEGSVPEGASPERTLGEVLGLEGIVVAEVIGPQKDPESGEELFLATGRLDYPDDPAEDPGSAAPEEPAPAGEVG